METTPESFDQWPERLAETGPGVVMYRSWPHRIDGEKKIKCPYGESSDLLWVRETWRPASWDDDGLFRFEYRDGKTMQCNIDAIPVTADFEEWNDRLWNQVSDECERAGAPTNEEGGYVLDSSTNPIRWRPSIYMPRWASRITLNVTGVRVERLQDISAPDAQAEGLNVPWKHTPILDFQHLWDYINGKRPGCSWANNPWVWAVQFERVGGTG